MTKQQQPEMARPEFYQDNEEEGRMVDNPNIQALTQLNAAEINQQIMTARAYPRQIEDFRKEMRTMVTYDQPTALSCLYALKRSGKLIEGPSIRFAEAALQAWGNSRAGARITEIGDEFITAQGFFYDLEKNMAVAFEVMRRITDRDGNRYNDDMIGVTGNAACSVAFRNAVLKGIPRTAWNPSYQAARAVSIGEGESISVKRDNMIKAFAPLNVDKVQIFAYLGVAGIDDISVDDLIVMGGVLNSIKDGEVTAEEAFSPRNNLAPGQVAPPQPRRSDFQRGTNGTTGEKKGAEAPKPDPKAPDPKASEKAAEPKAEEAKAPVNDPPAAGPSISDQLNDWYLDQKKELEGLAKVRDVTALRDAVWEQLEGEDELLKEWDALCAAKIKEILDKTKATGRKGK